MVIWRREAFVHTHSAVCETFWCSSISYIYGQLEEGPSALRICAFFFILKVFTVVVFHTSLINWSGGQSALHAT